VASAVPFADRQSEVIERLRQPPPVPVPDQPAPVRWNLSRVRAAFNWLQHYSLSGVWRVLHRLGLGWRMGYPRQFSPDPDYPSKVAHLLRCLQQVALDPQRVGLVFLDEMGFWRWAEPGQDWMAAPPLPVTRLACAGTNRQWRIMGALNAFSGQVDYLDNYIVGRRVVGQMYQKLDQTYATLERLYVIQDNWSIHNHADVQTVLGQLPRLEVVWLPTYAHWLNPIEKLWRWLRQDVLRLHPWAADWSQLLGQVHAFLDQFAHGSNDLLRYVGLLGEGELATALRSR
jgi:hypothetical protein